MLKKANITLLVSLSLILFSAESFANIEFCDAYVTYQGDLDRLQEFAFWVDLRSAPQVHTLQSTNLEQIKSIDIQYQLLANGKRLFQASAGGQENAYEVKKLTQTFDVKDRNYYAFDFDPVSGSPGDYQLSMRCMPLAENEIRVFLRDQKLWIVALQKQAIKDAALKITEDNLDIHTWKLQGKNFFIAAFTPVVNTLPNAADIIAYSTGEAMDQSRTANCHSFTAFYCGYHDRPTNVLFQETYMMKKNHLEKPKLAFGDVVFLYSDDLLMHSFIYYSDAFTLSKNGPDLWSQPAFYTVQEQLSMYYLSPTCVQQGIVQSRCSKDVRVLDLAAVLDRD
ncbi:MAG: hypothetical protein KDK51_04825 [Deltaproteobacteria bacterium]|nr:hypothetical protein [Deltaproteobacteria bacterium]